MNNLTLTPFYHSAVNAVTRPNKFTPASHYFVDRWMPLLGGNGTMIVLALRRDGFLNRKTGERRDEVVISRTDLAAAAGLSEDTLTREMGINRKTGKPQNEWLHQFVQKRHRTRRNRLGQVRQEESAYWVSMDDPVHPDDWHLVEEAAREAGWRQEKKPGTHFASSAYEPEPQSAEGGGQSAVTTPQNAEPEPQSASRLKSLDSLLPKNTLNTPAVASKFSASPLSEPEKKEPDGPPLPTGRQQIKNVVQWLEKKGGKL